MSFLCPDGCDIQVDARILVEEVHFTAASGAAEGFAMGHVLGSDGHLVIMPLTLEQAEGLAKELRRERRPIEICGARLDGSDPVTGYRVAEPVADR